MHALIVVSHPDPQSLTHQVAAEVANGIQAQGGGTRGNHSVEVADLFAEGFDPRFNPHDLGMFRNQGGLPADIVAEQARVDRADALVLVFPVYWWSFPGLLKGWIDRVFTNDWAYAESGGGKLQRLPVHLLAIGASSRGSYERHGYDKAMKVQIDHGIFGYCGAPVVTSELLSLSDEGAPQASLSRARRIGQAVFAG